MTRKAIIIGASSGIGEALAFDLDAAGYSLGLAARRTELLKNIASKLQNPAHVQTLDQAQPEAAAAGLRELIEEMKDVDLFVLSAGVGFDNPTLSWTPELNTININVAGFTCLLTAIVEYLERRGSGHIAGISSIAAIRGHGDAPAYGASKAYMSNYLASLRRRFKKKGFAICVTDIQPGFVNTAMAQSSDLFWVAPVALASKQIVRGLRKRKSHLYVTRRWVLVAWILRLFPSALTDRL